MGGGLFHRQSVHSWQRKEARPSLAGGPRAWTTGGEQRTPVAALCLEGQTTVTHTVPESGPAPWHNWGGCSTPG